MTDPIIITQPAVTNVVVTAPGPQGATGSPGLVPIFSRQNAVTPLVGNTRFYFDATRVISQVRASVGTAPTGSGMVIDTLINGTSIGTVTIPAGQNTATITPARTVNAGDYATVSIISVGSAITGADLTVVLTVN